MPRTPPGGGPPPSPPPRQVIPYGNPLRQVGGLVAERVDMGVDYSGQGPVFALGPGVITYAGTGNTGWGPPAGIAPGGFIEERIESGPLAGRYVYFAEAVEPSVRVGQRVTSGTVIGRMIGGIETGFASGSGTGTLASQLGEAPPVQNTDVGFLYSTVLHRFGAPSGVMSGQPRGVAPALLRRQVSEVLAGQAGGGGGTVNPPPPGTGGSSIWDAIWGSIFGIGGATVVSDVTGRITAIGHAIDWLLNPSNWIRIIAGVGGGILVIAGVYSMTHSGAVQVMGTEVNRPAALPMGIFMVGAGGVLLFIAFHQLPVGVQGIGGLIGYEQAKAQAAAHGGAA